VLVAREKQGGSPAQAPDVTITPGACWFLVRADGSHAASKLASSLPASWEPPAHAPPHAPKRSEGMAHCPLRSRLSLRGGEGTAVA